MKEKEKEVYRNTLRKISQKLAEINVHLQYGLSNEEKSFLEIVNELVDDLNKKRD